MPESVERDDHLSLVVRAPLPGMSVTRFAGERPLIRAVLDRYGTTMHMAGRSQWRCGGAQWSSAPGSVSVKIPGEVVVERAREGIPEFQIVWFDAALVEEARATLERPLTPPGMHAIDPRDPRAQALVTLHHNLLGDEPAHVLEEAMCDALHAFVDVSCRPRGVEPEPCARFSGPVRRARALLDEHFTENVGLETLAAHARLDKFRLCRSFREQIGVPPHAYVTHRRIALAQNLLARGMAQAEVAASVGFYDQSLLHRHFKRILGFTPGAFARANRQS